MGSHCASDLLPCTAAPAAAPGTAAPTGGRKRPGKW